MLPGAGHSLWWTCHVTLVPDFSSTCSSDACSQQCKNNNQLVGECSADMLWGLVFWYKGNRRRMAALGQPCLDTRPRWVSCSPAAPQDAAGIWLGNGGGCSEHCSSTSIQSYSADIFFKVAKLLPGYHSLVTTQADMGFFFPAGKRVTLTESVSPMAPKPLSCRPG